MRQQQGDHTPSAPRDPELGNGTHGGPPSNYNHGNDGGGQAPALFDVTQKTPDMFTPLSSTEEEPLMPAGSSHGGVKQDERCVATTQAGASTTGPYVPLQQQLQTVKKVHYRRSKSLHTPDTWQLYEPTTIISQDRELPELTMTTSSTTPFNAIDVTQNPKQLYEEHCHLQHQQAAAAPVPTATEQPTSETLDKMASIAHGMGNIPSKINKLVFKK